MVSFGKSCLVLVSFFMFFSLPPSMAAEEECFLDESEYELLKRATSIGRLPQGIFEGEAILKYHPFSDPSQPWLAYAASRRFLFRISLVGEKGIMEYENVGYGAEEGDFTNPHVSLIEPNRRVEMVRSEEGDFSVTEMESSSNSAYGPTSFMGTIFSALAYAAATPLECKGLKDPLVYFEDHADSTARIFTLYRSDEVTFTRLAIGTTGPSEGRIREVFVQIGRDLQVRNTYDDYGESETGLPYPRKIVQQSLRGDLSDAVVERIRAGDHRGFDAALPEFVGGVVKETRILLTHVDLVSPIEDEVFELVYPPGARVTVVDETGQKKKRRSGTRK